MSERGNIEGRWREAKERRHRERGQGGCVDRDRKKSVKKRKFEGEREEE